MNFILGSGHWVSIGLGKTLEQGSNGGFAQGLLRARSEPQQIAYVLAFKGQGLKNF